MKRGYQKNFSTLPAGQYNSEGRVQKARTMHAVLTDFLDRPLEEMNLLNVGGSSGAIDDYLADHFRSVINIDIDELAIERAKQTYQKPNLEFQVGDALNLNFPDESFDVVVCSHVYEHVPSAEKMMDEISRVLVPGGVCYFTGSNRFMWNEPHYNLPLLSAIPRPLAHIYIRLAKKADYYHELHYTYWGLKKLARPFVRHDYTLPMLSDPAKFHIEYMMPKSPAKAALARFACARLTWIFPRFIWILEKPSQRPSDRA